MIEKLKIKIQKWLGIDAIARRLQEHNTDIVHIMEIQLDYKEQYPLEDRLEVKTVVPTGPVKKKKTTKKTCNKKER